MVVFAGAIVAKFKGVVGAKVPEDVNVWTTKEPFGLMPPKVTVPPVKY
jgi:hypothetical protein